MTLFFGQFANMIVSRSAKNQTTGTHKKEKPKKKFKKQVNSQKSADEIEAKVNKGNVVVAVLVLVMPQKVRSYFFPMTSMPPQLQYRSTSYTFYPAGYLIYLFICFYFFFALVDVVGVAAVCFVFTALWLAGWRWRRWQPWWCPLTNDDANCYSANIILLFV